MRPGAVCGQRWGEARIPAEWIDGLARLDMIEQVLDGLLRAG
jgi:hypothetical protein